MREQNCTNCSYGQWSLDPTEKEEQDAYCSDCKSYDKWIGVREVKPDERG